MVLQQRELCGVCEQLKDHCSLCLLPVTSTATSLPDGRFLCPRDARIVVLEADRAKEVCAEARTELERLLVRFLTLPETNVTLTIEDQVHMDEELQAPGFERQCPYLVGYTRSRVVNEGRWKHSIGILGARPAESLMAVCAHEYAHTWLKENVPVQRETDRDAIEGFCELVAYRLSAQLDHEREMKAIRRNAYSRGQIDLFLEVEETYGFNTILEWMKFGEDERLNKDDLDRIRRVEIKPPANARPAPLGPPPPPALTPVPDVLTLIGISGTRSNRLALINDRAFREKETGRVRVGLSNVTLECLEIRGESVLIRVADADTPRELRLKTP
jgi:hypothetical protein